MYARRIASSALLSVIFFTTLGIQHAHAVPTVPITNPGAETGDFTGWTTTSAGDPWAVVDGFAHTGTKSFVSSYLTGTLVQTIDLLAAGFTEEELDAAPAITIATWVTGYDGGSGTDDHYDFELELQGAGHGAIVTHSTGDLRTSSHWKRISRQLSGYGPGLRFVKITATGYDSAFWEGNYGAAFDDFTLTVGGDTTTPTVTSVSPNNGGTNVGITDNLTLTFDEPVIANGGNITIHRTSDATAVATIDVMSAAVTGTGTNTISVDIPGTLTHNTSYYVLVDAGAFQDLAANDHAGFTSDADWTFRTRSEDGSAIRSAVRDYAIANVQATYTNSSSVNITWDAGADVRIWRALVSTDNQTWKAVSDFLPADTHYVWHPSAEYQGKQVTVLIESSDLANRLGSAVSNSLFLATQEEAPLAFPTSARSPFTGEFETVSAVEPNSYIRSEHFNTVYYVDDDLVRHPIVDIQTFFTWNTSFDVVRSVTDATLSLLPLGLPVLPKPGVVLVKIQSIPDVFSIEADVAGKPVLRHIPDEITAQHLFGASWQDYVIDVSPALFARFGNGSPMTAKESVDMRAMKRRIELDATE